MLDYKLLQALASVIENGGFERAGEALGLTQSAVSQRLKSLEVRLGQPLLTRHPELKATPAGQKLLTHYQQVQLLERDLRQTVREKTLRIARRGQWPIAGIGNRDGSGPGNGLAAAAKTRRYIALTHAFKSDILIFNHQIK